MPIGALQVARRLAAEGFDASKITNASLALVVSMAPRVAAGDDVSAEAVLRRDLVDRDDPVYAAVRFVPTAQLLSSSMCIMDGARYCLPLYTTAVRMLEQACIGVADALTCPQDCASKLTSVRSYLRGCYRAVLDVRRTVVEQGLDDGIVRIGQHSADDVGDFITVMSKCQPSVKAEDACRAAWMPLQAALRDGRCRIRAALPSLPFGELVTVAAADIYGFCTARCDDAVDAFVNACDDAALLAAVDPRAQVDSNEFEPYTLADIRRLRVLASSGCARFGGELCIMRVGDMLSLTPSCAAAECTAACAADLASARIALTGCFVHAVRAVSPGRDRSFEAACVRPVLDVRERCRQAAAELMPKIRSGRCSVGRFRETGGVLRPIDANRMCLPRSGSQPVPSCSALFKTAERACIDVKPEAFEEDVGWIVAHAHVLGVLGDYMCIKSDAGEPCLPLLASWLAAIQQPCTVVSDSGRCTNECQVAALHDGRCSIDCSIECSIECGTEFPKVLHRMLHRMFYRMFLQLWFRWR